MGATLPHTDTVLRDRARQLRREPTEAENRLWAILRGRQLHGAHFRRQHPIPPYVADFACVAARLVIEVDGGQHADGADTARDTYLTRHGWQVLRFWNNEVLENLDGVAQRIAELLQQPPPRPASGEGGSNSGSLSRNAGEGWGGGSGSSSAMRWATPSRFSSTSLFQSRSTCQPWRVR